MNTDSYNNREDKKPSPELMNKIHEAIGQFKQEIEHFEHMRAVAYRDGFDDKRLRTYLVTNTDMSCAFIDAMMAREYERAYMIAVDKVIAER